MKREKKLREGAKYLLQSDIVDQGENANLWIAYVNKTGEAPKKADFITGVVRPPMGLRYLLEIGGKKGSRKVGMYNHKERSWHFMEEAYAPGSRVVDAKDLKEKALKERLHDPRVEWIRHPFVMQSIVAKRLYNDFMRLDLDKQTISGKFTGKMSGRRPFTDEELEHLETIRKEFLGDLENGTVHGSEAEDAGN